MSVEAKYFEQPAPRHYRKYGDKFAVLCKCPKCGVLHLRTMSGNPPMVMPRVFCPDHVRLREIY